MFSWPLIGSPFEILKSFAVVCFRAHELVLVVWCRSRASKTVARDIANVGHWRGRAKALGQGSSNPGELWLPDEATRHATRFYLGVCRGSSLLNRTER